MSSCTQITASYGSIELFFRAVLEDLAHGSGPVSSSVRCDDAGQHLPRGFRLQERQICPETQVRTFRNDPHAAVTGSCGLVGSIPSLLLL